MPKDKVIINNLLVQGVIGVNDWEREKAQDILINIEVLTDLTEAGKSDSIEHSIDYHALSKKVIANVKEAQHYTVEALASSIAALCLGEKYALKVRVRVEKPQAIPSAQSAGVEIERSK